jgi:catalase
MIGFAKDADEENGRLLRKGLANASKGESSRKPPGGNHADEAPDKAIEKGHDAEPY